MFLAFCSFFMQCRMLQIVNLKCCTLMDNNAVMCLVESCAYLVCLCLAGCHMISDKALHSIAQKCRYLQALDLAKTKVCNIFVCSKFVYGFGCIISLATTVLLLVRMKNTCTITRHLFLTCNCYYL